MKRVIGKKIYDTEKAKEVASWDTEGWKVATIVYIPTDFGREGQPFEKIRVLRPPDIGLWILDEDSFYEAACAGILFEKTKVRKRSGARSVRNIKWDKRDEHH